MLLSFRFLNDVGGVNTFRSSVTAEIAQGDSQSLYVQIFDKSLDKAEEGYSPPGRRYMPASPATMAVTFSNLDTGPNTNGGFAIGPRINPTLPTSFVRVATQPFAGDGSIWLIPILSTDPLNGTVQMKVVLSESGRTLTVAPMPGLQLRVR